VPTVSAHFRSVALHAVDVDAQFDGSTRRRRWRVVLTVVLVGAAAASAVRRAVQPRRLLHRVVAGRRIVGEAVGVVPEVIGLVERMQLVGAVVLWRVQQLARHRSRAVVRRRRRHAAVRRLLETGTDAARRTRDRRRLGRRVGAAAVVGRLGGGREERDGGGAVRRRRRRRRRLVLGLGSARVARLGATVFQPRRPCRRAGRRRTRRLPARGNVGINRESGVYEFKKK